MLVARSAFTAVAKRQVYRKLFDVLAGKDFSARSAGNAGDGTRYQIGSVERVGWFDHLLKSNPGANQAVERP
jgi:hypothetical protein